MTQFKPVRDAARSMTRRRFMSFAASAAGCALAGGRGMAGAMRGEAAIFRGRAFGAEVSLRIAGLDRDAGARLWRRVERQLERFERAVSLYRPSELTRLNATGLLAHPGPEMRALIDLSDRVHAATGGAFDPSVQAIWTALAKGGDGQGAVTGWHHVDHGKGGIRLAPGMALTFNGIAQGAAADRVAALMRREGLRDVLIDMGEIVGMGDAPEGGPDDKDRGWDVGIAGPGGALLGRTVLRGRALATSSPYGSRVGAGGAGHIMHPDGRAPIWRTVSVSAESAALADALSTAFCLMDRAQIAAALPLFPDVRLELSQPFA